MPHLRFRALNPQHVQELSESLPALLAKTMETATDNFTFESIATEFFSEGKSIPSFPFIEVLWFERSQKIKIDSAKIITEKVKKLNPDTDVVVLFVSLPKADYFENGHSF